MKFRIRVNSLAASFLAALDVVEDSARIVFASRRTWNNRFRFGSFESYKTTVYRLIRAGFIEIYEDAGKKNLRLTKDGKIQVLISKSRFVMPAKWDGKWRIVLFDIPEENNKERKQLRQLLLLNGYKKFQQSVYICPWPLNRDAIEYLKATGLIKFIRIARLDELDDDRDLKKTFNLVS